MRRSREILKTMRTLEMQMERLDAAIITRYPDSERAADEFSALRKAVNAAASAAMVQRQSLVGLVNAIDEGASSHAIRGRLFDLLSTLSMIEVRPSEIALRPPHEWAMLFEEVGDNAKPRSAWIHETDEGGKVVQRGYIDAFPQQSNDPKTVHPDIPTDVESPQASCEEAVHSTDHVRDVDSPQVEIDQENKE